jgi:hypothetical protein
MELLFLTTVLEVDHVGEGVYENMVNTQVLSLWEA